MKRIYLVLAVAAVMAAMVVAMATPAFAAQAESALALVALVAIQSRSTPLRGPIMAIKLYSSVGEVNTAPAPAPAAATASGVAAPNVAVGNLWDLGGLLGDVGRLAYAPCEKSCVAY